MEIGYETKYTNLNLFLRPLGDSDTAVAITRDLSFQIINTVAGRAGKPILTNNKKGENTCRRLIIDLHKAFYRIERNVLIYIVQRHGIPALAFRRLTSTFQQFQQIRYPSSPISINEKLHRGVT